MLKTKLNKDLYQKMKQYIETNGVDTNGEGEYVIDENIRGTQYDFTVSLDDIEETVEVIEGFILDYKDGYYQRGYELFTKEVKDYFEIILGKIQNNS